MKSDSLVSKIKMGKLPFWVGTFSEVVTSITTSIQTGKSQIILPCSLNDLASVFENENIAKSYQSIDVCTTDGMPLVWLSRVKASQKNERVYGPDLMVELCKKTAPFNLRHVFYGSTELTLQKLQTKLKQLSPSMNITGSIFPPMHTLSPSEESRYIKQIKKMDPDIVWVGLSSPLQIEVAARWKKDLPHVTFICVGAAFDFIAGNKSMAPNWMKQNGLEWFFRLISEPKRLWKRYLVTIPKFLLFHGFELILDP